MEILEYKGNKFAVVKPNYWHSDIYCISVEEIASAQVWLPETYQGKPIAEWCESKSKKQSFGMAKGLHIPAAIERIDICNTIFPELETVEIDPANPKYTTDGRLIIFRKENELSYCPVCRGRSMAIPEDVKKIRENAFYGTQYEEILFPKKEIGISEDAFKGSRWIELQGEVIVIGAMLYKFPADMKQLTVPGHVRKFHPKLFEGYHGPEKLETPVMPNSRDIDMLNRQGKCRFLAVTSKAAGINISLLRKWQSLEEVVIADGHKKYMTLDGVVYSRDGRTLAWYPSYKKADEFRVPDGVRKIGEFAFAGQAWVKKVILPDSVSALGTGAFSGCQQLEDVRLPAGVREIPDSSTYRGAGVFAWCPKLKSVTLPEKLNYLGSHAFYKSGLRSIRLNEGLEQIGEYALMAEGLKEVALPPSVRRVGKGALFFVEKAKVYEGTAKGLVAAVNASWPYMKENSLNLKWDRCRITVLHKKSEKIDYFLIPESLKKSAAYHLEIAWNAERIDYEEYDQCLDEITDSEEKIEFAQQGLRRFQEGEDNAYMDYIRKVSYKMGYRLLEEGKEKEFLLFLKQDFLSENSLQKLLRFCNGKGETVCAAYITEMLSKKGRKGRSFRI